MDIIIKVTDEDTNKITFELEVQDMDMVDEVFDTFCEMLPETLKELTDRLEFNAKIRRL